jgi:hypothetical protein
MVHFCSLPAVSFRTTVQHPIPASITMDKIQEREPVFATRQMKHGRIRKVGGSLYVRIPAPFARLNGRANQDLAFWVPVEGRPDTFQVTVAKLPLPPELMQYAEACRTA